MGICENAKLRGIVFFWGKNLKYFIQHKCRPRYGCINDDEIDFLYKAW